jgi:hypothetical protein
VVVGKCFDGKLFEQHKTATGRGVPQSWILLDNQSTVDVFCNKRLLRNIREAPHACKISCNAEVVEVALIGDLLGYPAPVWYCPSGIAIILSLHLVNEHCRVQYDSFEAGRAFHVTKPDGSTRDFKPSASGLHYCETDEDDSDNDDDNSYDHEPHPVGGVDYNDQEHIPNGDGDDDNSNRDDDADDTGNGGFVSDDTRNEDSADDTGDSADNTGDEDNRADDTGDEDDRADDTGDEDADGTEDGDVDDTPERVSPRAVGTAMKVHAGVSAGVSAGDADDTDDEDADGTEDGDVDDTPAGVLPSRAVGTAMKVLAGVSAGDADGTEDGDVDDTPERVSPRAVGTADDTGDEDADGTEDGDVDDTPERVSPSRAVGTAMNVPAGVPAGVSAANKMDSKYGPRHRSGLRARKASVLGDMHTNPLQGAAFLKFRRLILKLDDGGPEMQAPLAHRSVLDTVVTWA